MEKYQKLISRNITLSVNSDVINSGKILKMEALSMSIAGLGKLYRVWIDWKDKELAGGIDYMDFDDKILDDFIKVGFSKNPLIPEMVLMVEGTYSVGETLSVN